MISCVNSKNSLFGRDLEQFEEIQNHFGWSEGVTRTKIGTWQTKNKTNEFPTIEEMKQYEKNVNKEKAESTGYTQEMISIRNQAIANGTFMKAPNGKPTNLNEKQWLQVRTKAFKNWFGNWESVAARIANAKVIWGHPGIGKTEYYKNNNNVIDFDSVYKPRINKELGLPEGAEERKKWRREHRDEYRQKILSLFDEAVEDAKKQGKQLLVSDMVVLQEREDALDLITQMSEDTFAKRSVQRNEPYDDNKKLWKTDIDENISKVSNKSKVVNTEKYLSELYEEAKNVSKVVDENGEPLVVYHGTVDEELLNTVDFSKSADKISFFGTSNRVLAGQYAQEDKHNNLINYNRELIDSRNIQISELKQKIDELKEQIKTGRVETLTMDYDLSPKQIESNKEYLKELEKELEELEQSETRQEEVLPSNVYPMFFNLKNPFILDAKGSFWNNLKLNDKQVTTRDVAKYAKEHNYDGVVIKNVYDNPSMDLLELYTGFGNVYIVTDSPNQVKSATGNVGTFSREDNNIYRGKAIIAEANNLYKEKIIEFCNRMGFNITYNPASADIINFINKTITLSNFSERQYNILLAKTAFTLMPNDLRTELINVGKKYNKTPELIYEDILKVIENKKTWLTKEPTLLEKIKKFINDLINKIFKNQTYYEELIDSAAQEITNRNSDWYKTVVQEGFELKSLDMDKLKESPLYEVYNTLVKLGASLDGSAAVRLQGTLYRKGDEDFHDLDFTKKYDSFSWDVKQELDAFFENYKLATNNFEFKDRHIYRDLRQQMLDNCTEHLKNSNIYKELSKHYSDIHVKHAAKTKELGLLVTLEVDGFPIDIFYTKEVKQHNINGFKVTDFSSAFSAKLVMGRDKDIRDIINFHKYGTINQGRTVIDAAADIKAQELFELQSEIDFYKAKLDQFKDSKYKQDFINKRISFYIDVVDKFKSRIKNTTARTVSAVEEILDTAKIYSGIIKPLRSVGYYTSDDSDGRIQYHPERISPVVNMQGIKKRTAQDLKSNITTLTRTVKNLEEKYKQVKRKDLQTIIDENNITDTSIFQGTASLNKNSIAEDKKLEIAEKGVKFDSDYQVEVIKHLETDKISYTDLERKELVTLAKALFDYFNKNDFKIRIVTKPYSEKEAQVRSSAVSTIGKYATIYYVKQDNQESPFITLLHELLHIATSDAMPFDAEGRAIEDEQLQNYYSIFCSYVSRDPEYNKYSQQLMNAKSSDEYYAVPYKYRVLHHATESVGEFFSSFLNEKDVRDTVSSITYGKGRNLLEWLRDKIEEILSKIFKGYSHIQNTEVLKDITNFLLNYQYQGESNLRYMDSEYKEYITERNKENELEFNNALPYKDITATKASVQTISEEFYTKQALYDYINDLVADGIKREDITINHTPETEDTDEYWTVSYNQPTTKEFDIANAEFYSGAAKGSDKYWGEQARALGIKVKDYTTEDWDNLSQEWKDRLDGEYQEVVSILNRKVLDKSSYSGKLVRRDMMQADKADAIFAIGTIGTNGYVNGGTAYATTRGIQRGVPVYIFDQFDNKWKIWDKNTNSFVETEMPTLTPHAATIGTRGINEAGKQAIQDILNATINQPATQEITPEQQLLEQKLDYFNQELHLLENFGSKDGPMHTIPYREYAKINKVFESFGYAGERSISSYLYKIYGDNLKDIFDYNKETKELTVNNWVYELINLINQDPEKICNLLEFLYDGVDEVIVKVENGISQDKKIINKVTDQLSQLKTSTNQPTTQETPIEQPIDTHQEKEIVDLTPDRQMKQVWNPTILNSRIIRVTQIFKDIVTKLENQLDDREKLATSAATRQYLITTKYGSKNILDKVREEIQNTYANRDWVENFVHKLYDETDWNTQEVKDKIDYIYQQGQYMIQFFEPLMMEASTEIKRLEKVSILTNDGELTQDDFEEDNTKAEEELSKHEEGWFYESHEQSVESTLSSEVKTILNNLYEKDNEGFQTRFDNLEQPIPLDYRVALGTCLYITGKCTSDNEMIPSLQEYANKYPWLQDVVNILMGIDTDTSKFYEGLSDEDIELKAYNMRSLFWRDMHKILVNIAEQSKDDNGNIITKILNKLEGADALDAEFEDNCYNNKTLFSNEGKPYKMVYKADGTFNKVNYDALHKEIAESKLYQNISTGKVTEAEIDLIERALKAFGVNISKENITDLFATGDKTKWATLHSVIFGFYAANQATNQPLQSVIGEEKANIYDAFREKYDMLSTLFADKSEGRDESSVYVTIDGESKRLFSRIFPNRIHTLFNRLLNRDSLSEKDYKARLNEKYGHDWWYAAENPDGETPKFTGVLKDLWTSKKDRETIKIKTLKASQGISYAGEIDAQAEETRLNEFETTKSNGYADYSVPTFSDTSESYYATMKYFDIQNAEQRQELISRLTDVVRQEIRRINVVRERARVNKEAYDAGLPLPIQTIACWDVQFSKEKGLKETSTDGTNFHFLPALNNNKETFLKKFNDLSNDPAAQQQLLERAVIYALNEEFKTYLKFYNQTQVNQLPNSKHTEKGNKQFISYIQNTIQARQNIPLNDTQLVELNRIIDRLSKETIHPEDFAFIKERVSGILTSNIADAQWNNNVINTINSFQQDTSNLTKLEDYLWNFIYATTQIINLTIKDPAFLGTADKVQKRYKMYYSPVQTAYTTEYDLKAFRETGELIEIDEKLAKKTEYSLVLVDDIIDEVYSFDNLKSLVDKKVDDGYLTNEQAVEILSNLSDIYAKTKGKRAEINLADAQCYRTLPSWQKCLNMIGKGYNKKMQQSINRLMNPEQYGEWSYEDFHNVWEIFKPFVASDMTSPSGIENTFGSQYAEIGMPVMHKNAEFLLLAMYNQLSGVMKDNWKLKALNEFMVKHGIDKAQFESAVKLGSQGAININNCTTPEEVISTLEIATGLNGSKQADEGDKQVVHSIPFEDWGISTSMPEHLLDHPESAMGTQLMKIITEGLSENPNKTLKVGDRTMTYAQWLEEYQALQMANLMDDFAEVGEIFTNNAELVKYLKKQILTQNKYSHELLHHLELDENGNFKYPLIDPMLRNQFDALCSSLIRNNVTKRKRRMGALPQVAAFGFEEDLQIRCTDRNGTLLRTKKEFEEYGSNIQGIETWEAYKEYCDNNATNIAYMEVYMPHFDTTLMRKINDACVYKENVYDKNGKPIHRSGEFNHQLFNKIFAKDLLNGLSNRVPTETKHSIIPIYVKGFLPAQNSSCVVVPAEWIAISDSDNDGDKLYCYFYHSKAVWNVAQMKKDWAGHYNWNYISKAKRDEMRASKSNYRTEDFTKSEELDILWEQSEHLKSKGLPLKTLVTKTVNPEGSDFEYTITNIRSFDLNSDNVVRALQEFKKQAFGMYDKYCKIEPVEFKIKELDRIEGESNISYQHRCEMASIASNSFEARNNRMLDLERAVLQTDENSVQMLIPGGFPIIKKVVNEVIKPLYNATKDVMSICNPATRTIQQIRNMAGANLVGIYANHRSFRPLLERAKCTLHANNQPTINGNVSLPRENGVLTWSLSASTNAKGEFISDNISNFSGASVDNAKDPLLSWLGQNTITAPLTMFLIHCGYTIEEVALFMNQPSIKKAVKESFITGESLESIVKRDYRNLKDSVENFSDEVSSHLYNDTMKDQIRRETEGILPTIKDNYIQAKVLENLMAIMPASRALQRLINVTKADTQVGALQAKSSENKSKLIMYDRVASDVANDFYPIIGAEALVPEINTIEDIQSSELPLTAAFRYLGVESIADFTKDISISFTKLVDRVLSIAMLNYDGITLNDKAVESLTHATTSYIFSKIAALSKGDRKKRFDMALSVLKDVKTTPLGKDNILIRDLIVNLNGNYYSKKMPFIKLKRLNNNYTATESYRRAWEDLIVNGNRTIQLKDRTITYQQLSNLLFNYCFMVSGLTKRGNSFINCFPTAYIDRIEGYNELLKTIPDMDISDEIATNIFEQYIANHPEDSKFVHRVGDVQKFLDKSKVVPDVIQINNFKGNEDWYKIERIMKQDQPMPYNYITFTDKNGNRYLYKGSINVGTGSVTYNRMTVLGNSRNGYLEEYESGANTDFDSGIRSIIKSNRNLYIDAGIQSNIDKKMQEAALQGQELGIDDLKQLFERILGDGSDVHIDLFKYSPSEEDATGMKFCAII